MVVTTSSTLRFFDGYAISRLCPRLNVTSSQSIQRNLAINRQLQHAVYGNSHTPVFANSLVSKLTSAKIGIRPFFQPTLDQVVEEIVKERLVLSVNVVNALNTE